MKRFFSVLLVAILIVTSLSVMAFAAEPGGTAKVTCKVEGEFANFGVVISADSGLTITGVSGATYNAGTGRVAWSSNENTNKVTFTVYVKIAEDIAPGEYFVYVSPVTSTKRVPIEQDNDGIADGYVAANNTYSGGKVVIEAPKCEHDNTEWKTTKNPTCTEKGEKALICKDCGVTIKTEVIPALGHDIDGVKWTTVKEPDCVNDGKAVKYCNRCGEVVESKTLDALGHDIDGVKWTTVKEPDCVKEGKAVKYCKVCDEVAKTKTLDALGHKWNEDWAKDDDYHWHECSVCGEIKDHEEHFMEWIIDKYASYVSTGLKHEECVICGQHGDTAVIPMKVKDPDNDDVPPTGDISSTFNFGIYALLIGLFSVVAIVYKRRTVK